MAEPTPWPAAYTAAWISCDAASDAASTAFCISVSVSTTRPVSTDRAKKANSTVNRKAVSTTITPRRLLRIAATGRRFQVVATHGAFSSRSELDCNALVEVRSARKAS